MSPARLLMELFHRKVGLRRNGPNLQFFPEDEVTDDLLGVMKEHKAVLLRCVDYATDEEEEYAERLDDVSEYLFCALCDRDWCSFQELAEVLAQERWGQSQLPFSEDAVRAALVIGTVNGVYEVNDKDGEFYRIRSLKPNKLTDGVVLSRMLVAVPEQPVFAGVTR